MPADVTIHRLTHDLSDLSNRLLVSTLPAYVRGEIRPYPQDPSRPVTFSRKLTKADGDIIWTKPAAQIEREVRAYLGWPGSRAIIAGVEVTITAAHVASPVEDAKAISIPCGDHHALVIDRLKPAGKREMTGREFLAGHPTR
jgi:methionyl-tRNA formyltransferase